jgi:hypothetical protein
MEVTGSSGQARIAGAEGALGGIQRLLRWRVAALLALFAVLYLFVASLTIGADPGVFTSPDEAAHFRITREFGEHGRLYYTRDFVGTDSEQLLRPRALWYYEDKIVLPNSMGLPFLYGAGYAVFGDNVAYAALLLAPVCLWFLYETAALLTGRRSLLLAAAFFGAGPLLYWFARPYWNSLGATAFFAGGLYFLVRYYHSKRMSDVAWLGLLFSLSMLFRYNYPLYLVPLAAMGIYYTHGREAWRTALRDFALFGAVVFLFFLVPVVAFSEHVYGRPIVFPTSLQRESVEAGSAFDLDFAAHLLALGGKALLPDGFDPLFVAKNLVRFTFVLVPAFTVLALAGLAVAFRDGALRLRKTWPLGAILVYYILFVGSVSTTNDATGFNPTFQASVLRYWMLLYVAMYFFVAYLLVRLPDLISGAWPRIPQGVAAVAPWLVALVLAGSTMPVVYYAFDGSLDITRRAKSELGEPWIAVTRHAEPDGIVYAVGEYHKYVGTARDMALLIGVTRTASSADPSQLTDEELEPAREAAAHVAATLGSHPVYVLEANVDMPLLEYVLRERGLTLQRADDQPIDTVVPCGSVCE